MTTQSYWWTEGYVSRPGTPEPEEARDTEPGEWAAGQAALKENMLVRLMIMAEIYGDRVEVPS